MRKLVLIIIIAVPLAFFSYIALEGTQNFTLEDRDISQFDDDNDGIVNAIDAFSQNPEEWDDFDFDGIGANEDEDDDNDGILDINDPSPSPVSTQLTMKYLDLIEDCAIMDPGLPRQLCYRDFFVSSIEKGESNADIMNLVFFFAKLGVIDDCHFSVHHIGYAAFEKNPDLAENLMEGISTCRNGFYHGVLSAYFDNLESEGKDFSNWYKEGCDEFVDTKKYQPCLHGIGHGLVFYYNDDLESSVDACHELPVDQSSDCIDGVMMQYTDNELTASTSFEEVMPEMCSKIEMTTDDRTVCNGQMGRTLGFLTNHDLVKSIEFCKLLDFGGEKYCTIGALMEIIESEWIRENGGPTGLDPGDQFGIFMQILDDLDGDGVAEIMIFAFASEPTENDLEEGLGYVLFMKPDGTTKSIVKISDMENPKVPLN